MFFSNPRTFLDFQGPWIPWHRRIIRIINFPFFARFLPHISSVSALIESLTNISISWIFDRRRQRQCLVRWSNSTNNKTRNTCTKNSYQTLYKQSP
jgi:hypothetical protein